LRGLLFAQQYPEAVGDGLRARAAAFMRDALGINLKPEVLPFFQYSGGICRLLC